MKIIKLLLVLYFVFSSNLLFCDTTLIKSSLGSIFNMRLMKAFKENNKIDIIKLLNYDANAFQALNQGCSWGVNENITKSKNSAFYYLIQNTSLGGSLDDLSVDEIEDILKMLLENNLDINLSSPNYTPLIYAIENDNYLLIELFIKYGADINKESGRKETPLMVALRLNKPNIVQLLLSLGADPHITKASSNYFESTNNEAKNAYLEYLKERKEEILSEQRLYDDVANIINQY